MLSSSGMRIANETITLQSSDMFGRAPNGSGLPPKTAALKYPWRTGIVATVFWVGEQPTKKNPTPNTASSWDRAWQTNFGGFDDPDPDKRAAGPDYRPATFVPQQNPFYVALPYNDVVDCTTTKGEAKKVIPWFKDVFQKPGRSVCRDRWIAVRYGDRVCYAQWSDCGPFKTTDANYVFGSARPSNTKNNGAGLDLAPAVRDYLGFHSGQRCDWRFVELDEVPNGPWKVYGTNNHFAQNGGIGAAGFPTRNDPVLAPASGPARHPELATIDPNAGSRLEELRRERDLWFKSTNPYASWTR